MNTKLTLNINDVVIRKAKAFARSRHKSLSKLVEQYLGFVTNNTTVSPTISDRIIAISDSLVVDPDFTYDELKEQYLQEKYLGAKDPH
ncbi:MAG: DUF6364 family protein [Spirochaetia bacterium]